MREATNIWTLDSSGVHLSINPGTIRWDGPPVLIHLFLFNCSGALLRDAPVRTVVYGANAIRQRSTNDKTLSTAVAGAGTAAGSSATGGVASVGGTSSGGASFASGGSSGAGAAGTAGSSAGGSISYTCTLVIGITATQEWYDAGFESVVDNSKWELIYVHSGFVELWANAKDPVWSAAVLSPCAQNASNPDRVIFVALNFDFNTLDQWLPPITAAVKNLQAKYQSAKRIELMTFIRAPADQPCAQAPAKRSTITPAQDDAMAMVAAVNPGLVVVAPKFEAKTCDEFTSNPPHPTTAGASAWANMVGAYYR
jgi:hypothetical protein